MKKNYITLIFLAFTCIAQAQKMSFSLSYIGINSGTGNHEIALVATPDFIETNGNSADMGAVISISGGGYLLPGTSGFVNDCVFIPPATNICDYAITETEWNATYLTDPSTASGRYVYQLLRTPGVTNVFFDAVIDTPIIMAVFQVAGNPTSGDIILVDNNDAILDGTPNENYLNINYPITTNGITADILDLVNTTPISFSTLSITDTVLDGVVIFPNPTKGLVFIKGISDVKTIELFNIAGQRVQHIDNTMDSIDMSGLQKGMYFIKITTSNGIATKKIMKY